MSVVAAADSELNVSLESHLLDALGPLTSCPKLPVDLADQLKNLLAGPSPTIPYNLLNSISRWSRTPAGIKDLSSRALDPSSYSIVSLLAGATTSPERKFPGYTPPKDPQEIEREKTRERRAITAILNSLLSILGCAAAAWFASQRTGWRDEWVSSASLLSI